MANILFSQDQTTDAADDLIIGKITFSGIKSTNPQYLLSIIPVKEGSLWNENKKKGLTDKLVNIKAIVEEVTAIREYKRDNNVVDLDIEILEKTAFIIIPYFKYSNSSGLMPKIVYRNYNVGGYRKYIDSKIEFLPKDNMSLYFRYEDPSVNNNDNLSYNLTGEFRTSVINYFANLNADGSTKGISPLGVIGGATDEPWEDELYIQGIFKGDLTYKIPKNDIKINPNLGFDYKRLLNKEEAAQLPVDKYKPSIGMDLSIPIKKINSYLKPSFSTSYSVTVGDEGLGEDLEISDQRNVYDTLSPSAKIAFTYQIPKLLATLEPWFQIKYEKNTDYRTMATSNYLNLIFGINFDKSFTFRRITHSFNIEAAFDQRVIGETKLTKQYIDEDDDIKEYKRSYSHLFKTSLDFTYKSDFNFFKDHHFKVRYLIFARYNDIKEFDGYSLGDAPGEFLGFLGGVANFKYELPLFYISTPKIATFTIKRPIRWQVFWDFFIDAGLAASDTLIYDDDIFYTYTLSKNLRNTVLHLYPALGVGTAIRIAPKFIPLEFEIKIGFDIYKILKTSNISGATLVLEINFNDKN